VQALTGGVNLPEFGRRVAMRIGIIPGGNAFILSKNARIFYFSHKFSFANFEFIFAIKDPKLARRDLDTP